MLPYLYKEGYRKRSIQEIVYKLSNIVLIMSNIFIYKIKESSPLLAKTYIVIVFSNSMRP
ncbi:hypothetical protein BD408DRAFT_415835 [Parasitella parasitica]|nr:hypothetical protein BD408DRAFT_415835 [Parasitella parasitica]